MRKGYYQKNKEKCKKYAIQWWQKNISKRKEYYIKNRKRNNATRRKRALTIRRIVFEHYGGSPPKCKNCKCSIFEVLDIDHISNNGRQMRKIKNLKGYQFYRWLLKNNFPKGYQILCKNCNWLKWLKFQKTLK